MKKIMLILVILFIATPAWAVSFSNSFIELDSLSGGLKTEKVRCETSADYYSPYTRQSKRFVLNSPINQIVDMVFSWEATVNNEFYGETAGAGVMITFPSTAFIATYAHPTEVKTVYHVRDQWGWDGNGLDSRIGTEKIQIGLQAGKDLEITFCSYSRLHNAVKPKEASAPIPEPATLVLLGVGLIGMGYKKYV